MHLTCPSCSATFKVEPEALARTRQRVRCGRCGHVWREGAGAPEAAAPLGTPPPRRPAAEPDPYAAPPRGERGGQPDPRRRDARQGAAQGHAPYPSRPAKRGGSIFGWIVFLLVIAGLVFSAWHFRGHIVAEVPETAEIYRTLGIPVETAGEGLEISGVTSVRRTVGGERRMVVSGSVVNVSEEAREVPMLRAVVSNSEGDELLSWEFAAGSRSLEPGEVATFETSAANPPDDSALSVEFAGPR